MQIGITTSNNISQTKTSAKEVNYRFKNSNKTDTINFSGRRIPKTDLEKIKELGLKAIGKDKEETNVINRFLTNSLKRNEKAQKLTESVNGVLYLIKAKKKKIVVKMRHFDIKENESLIKRKNANFDGEIEALQKLPEEVKFSNKLIATLKNNNNENFGVALTYAPGKNSDARKNKLKLPQIREFLDDLFELDKAKILHRDITNTNIKVGNKHIYLTDYGAAKTFGEVERLSNKPKYKLPKHLAPSNLDNFENLTFLTHLRQLSNSSKKGPQKADKLFLEYLHMKSDFHNKKFNLLKQNLNPQNPDKNLAEMIKNEKAKAVVFSRINPKNPDKLTQNVQNIETLRLKMLEAQKKARVYKENDIANPVTALYTTCLHGYYAKQLSTTSQALSKKYPQDKAVSQYLNAAKKEADFYIEETFLPNVKDTFKKMMVPFNENTKDLGFVDNVVKDGNWMSCMDGDKNWKAQGVHMYINGPTTRGEY